MKNKITITKLSATEYDITCPAIKRDAHLRHEDGAWVLDLFDSAKPTGKAHLETVTLEKMTNVVMPDWNEAFEWLGVLQ